MRIAIVCDDLIQYGGAERVFLDILDMYPNAVVYTSVISKRWKKILKDKNITYVTSFIQKLPFSTVLYRFYSILYLHVLAFESFNFDDFDIVLSLSSRYAHFIITKPTTKHVCYMHSPGRMFWDTSTYFNKEIWNIFLPLIYPFLFFVRQADYIASQRVDMFIANSKVTQARIKKYYNRESILLNPGINIDNFKQSDEVEDYYLIIGRLSPWKRNDIVIKACSNLNIKLKVLGTGPDSVRLKSISGDTVEFIGFQPDSVKYNLLSKCKALIYPQYEDFGIVPLEAMASGRPVIAYGQGGALETVLEGKTGMFFVEQTVSSLEDALKRVDQMQIISQNCIERAHNFKLDTFKVKLKNLINKVYLKK